MRTLGLLVGLLCSTVLFSQENHFFFGVDGGIAFPTGELVRDFQDDNFPGLAQNGISLGAHLGYGGRFVGFLLNTRYFKNAMDGGLLGVPSQFSYHAGNWESFAVLPGIYAGVKDRKVGLRAHLNLGVATHTAASGVVEDYYTQVKVEGDTRMAFAYEMGLLLNFRLNHSLNLRINPLYFGSPARHTYLNKQRDQIGILEGHINYSRFVFNLGLTMTLE